MKVALAGGGTGGHVFPAVSIAEELKKRDPSLQLMYIGKGGSVEERVASDKTIPFRSIIVEGVQGKNPIRKIYALLCAAIGLVQSLVILLRFRPHAVVGTGGYVSLPPVLAASILRIPTLIHEQNAVPGRANITASRFADIVAVNFEECLQYFSEIKTHVVGNPLRPDFLPEQLEAINQAESKQRLGLSPDKFTVFFLGGSRGAHALNVSLIDALSHSDPQRFQFVCTAGKDDYRRVRDACERAGASAAVFQFMDDIVTAYTAADLIVSRAGANALAEISAVGIPAILVPYPHSVDRHQELNARALVEAGAAEIILNGDLQGDRLASKFEAFSNDKAALKQMRAMSKRFGKPDAAEKIVNLLFELVFK